MGVNNYKPFLTDYLQQITKRQRNGMWICPLCGSGRNKNMTAALRVYDGITFKCFSCGEYGDIIDLIGKTEKVGCREAFQIAREMFGNEEPREIQENKSLKSNTKDLYKDYIESCAEVWTDYFKERGFSKKDAKKFRLGFDAEKNAIVIPYGKDNSYYLRRSLARKQFYKPKSSEAGPEPIFNKEALDEFKPCFICESPIDAISVMVASNYNAISIGGTGVRKLMDYIDKNNLKAPLVVSLDDDDGKNRNAGLEAAKELMGELAARRIPFVLAKYSKEEYAVDKRKDANDMFISNKRMFSEDLEANVKRLMVARKAV